MFENCNFMNVLHCDEVHTTFLDQCLVSFAMFQEELLREERFNSMFAQEIYIEVRFVTSTTLNSDRFI